MKVEQFKEDYIKAIYMLGHSGGAVTTSGLAQHLGVGDGSVTEMIKKLSSRKLISYTPYKGVALTSAGRQMALRLIRRHRLWEMFLVEYLGYRWDEIHDEAERLEHATSDELDRRLDRLLGYPKFDPHGDPIPDTEGALAANKETVLAEIKPGDIVTIARVTDDGGVLRHVAGLGMRLNGRITVMEKLNIDGSMKIRVGRRQQFISSAIANAVFVRKSKTPRA